MAKEALRIGRCGSPARILSHEIVKTQRIVISYGGGMGGANEKIYCTKKELKEGVVDMYELTKLSGEKIEINPNFIVKIEDKRLVRVVHDVSSHPYFNPKGYKQKTVIEYYELGYGEDYLIVDEYVSGNDDRIVRKEGHI